MTFTLVATTDVHGNLFSRSFRDASPVPWGAGRLSTYLQELRSRGEVVVVDNGDTNQGTALLTFYNKTSPRKIMAELWDYLGVDYCNIGNHDFNYGGAYLAAFVAALKCPLICNNVKYNGLPLGSSAVFEREGKTFALIGAVTDYIEHWETPANLAGVEVLPVFDTVASEVARLRPAVDYVIVVYHGGLEADPETGTPTEDPTGENIGYRLATQIPGIDLLITGHQHRSFTTFIQGIPVTQCRDKAAECVEISVDVDSNPAHPFNARVVDLSAYPVDTALETHFQEAWEATGTWLDTFIGTGAWDDLYITDFIQAQKDKHPFTTFVNQVQRELTGAELASCCMFETMPGWGKHLTYRDVFLNYPFPNTLVVKEITTPALLAYLDQLANYWRLVDGEIAVNPQFLEPKRELYNYDFIDGLEYTICVGTHRSWVEDVRFAGRPLPPEGTYRIAISNYRASGGGNYKMLVAAPTVYEDTRDMTEILIDYIKEHTKAGLPLTVQTQANLHLEPRY